MDDVLKGLQPESLWEHFDQIRQIPRGSKSEARIAAHLRAVGEKHGATVLSDAVDNVVLRVAATEGMEGLPTLVLQGHMDMVCEKEPDIEFDFDTDPIGLRREGDLLYACGTTLGADNGIGVAAGLATMTDPAVKHGPLELLFTVDEETGLTGAQELDVGMLEGRILLNLDSEEHGLLTIGCAGGADTQAQMKMDLEQVPSEGGWEPVLVKLGGLAGGHSGLDIHLGRGNAIVLLAAALRRCVQVGIGVRVASLAGGSKRNAIPRDAQAVVWTDDGGQLQEVLEAEHKALLARYDLIEEGLALSHAVLSADDPPRSVWPDAKRDAVFACLAALPFGVIQMSAAVPGLVQTSNNVGVATWEGDTLGLVLSTRSSVQAELEQAQACVVTTLRAAGFEAFPEGGYPGWEPDTSSPVLARLTRVYTEVFGEAPQRGALHAGLECGLLGGKLPGMDMISFGPDIRNPHSPSEYVSVSSVEKFWKLLLGLLVDYAADAE